MTAETFSAKRIGQYEIVDEIGIGGMGVVYKAVDTKLDRTVALKVIHQRVSRKGTHLERFKREAAVIATLHHPNVIRLYDYGEIDGVCYYTMEYLQAQTLNDLQAERNGPLSKQLLLTIGEGLCQALDYIHTQGFVHRDIKPGNIMVASNATVTLMDFGLVNSRELEALTKEGTIGTPRYMSPEMLQGIEADHRSDLFQLGLVLYTAATGSPAFAGRDVYVLARNVLTATPTPPSTLNKSVSRHFDEFISNCLAKSADQRYQSAPELLVDFKRALKNVPPLRKAPVDSFEEKSPTKRKSGRTSDVNLASSTLKLFISSMEASTITRPFFKFRDLPWPFKVLTVLLVTGTLCLLGSMRHVSTVTYGSHDFRVFPDLDALVIRWRSQVPYRSQLLWKTATAKDDDFVSTQSGTVATTIHEVILNDTVLGSSYTVKVLYPDGRSSLPHTVSAPTAREIDIRVVRTAWHGLSRLDVGFESSLPCRTTISYRHNGRHIERVLSSSLSKEHRLRLEDLGYEDTLQDVQLLAQTKKHERTVRLADIHGAAQTLHTFTKAVESFDGAAMVSRIRRTNLRRKKQGRAIETVRSIATKNPAFKSALALESVFKDAFASHSPASLTVKMALYEALRRLELFDVVLAMNECPPMTPFPSWYSTFIRQSHAPDLPRGPAFPLVTIKEFESTFLPTRRDQRPDGLVSKTGFAVLQATSDYPVRYRLDGECSLREIFPRLSARPRLVLMARNLTPEHYVRVKLNERGFVDFRNTLDSMPPTMWGELHGDQYLQSVREKESTAAVCNHVPRALLRPDDNHYAIELYLVPGMPSLHYVQLFGLWLLPQ